MKKVLSIIVSLSLVLSVLLSSVSVMAAGETNLAVSSVIASTSDSNGPENTLDGDLDTRWSGNGLGAWIKFDLGSSKTVSYVDIAFYRGDIRYTDFDIHVSEDNSTWTEVYSGANSNESLSAETFDFTDTTARYVRITGYGYTFYDGSTTGTWNSLTEVDIYGIDDTSGGGSTLPSEILDLTNWKITIPYDGSDSDDDADEIYQPELDSYEHSEYFHVNDAGDAVVFKAHCGGATTSGSSYPRSELREMDADDGDEASWSTTSGTHTMEITQKITHIPEVKQHVVVGQIHDSGDDLCVFRLEGTKLFVDENGDDGETLTSSYSLGDVFTVKFVAHNGGVDFYYNGDYIYTLTTSKSGCYFKAGMYTQSNESKGDDYDAYGECEIYDVWVSHS